MTARDDIALTQFEPMGEEAEYTCNTDDIDRGHTAPSIKFVLKA